jgi:SAM-dependent methyltransferase
VTSPLSNTPPDAFQDASISTSTGGSDENVAVYNDPDVVAEYAHSNGWINLGEQAAVMSVAHVVRGKRILDIGVGAGRTISLLSLLSDSYVGVDYTPGQLQAARQRYPHVDLRLVDARDLSQFDDGSFDFVFFSFNGIDCVDHDDRALVLSEMHRVLVPGGIVSYSTLNKGGQSFGERPWQLHRPGRRAEITARTTARFAWVNATDPGRFWRRSRNWRAGRRRTLHGSEWSVELLSAHDFNAAYHFVTLRGLREEVARASFELLAIYESEADRADLIPEDAASSDVDGFHVVARRPEGRSE